jgi:predicted Rossmann-fold nucleotide-binding protein
MRDLRDQSERASERNVGAAVMAADTRVKKRAEYALARRVGRDIATRRAAAPPFTLFRPGALLASTPPPRFSLFAL